MRYFFKIKSKIPHFERGKAVPPLVGGKIAIFGQPPREKVQDLTYHKPI